LKGAEVLVVAEGGTHIVTEGGTHIATEGGTHIVTGLQRFWYEAIKSV
jgi:hypothetical protein